MESNGKQTAYNVNLRIPFPTKNHAGIAYDVLRIDPEPKRNGVMKNLHLESNDLVASFSADQVKHIRVGINSFLDAIILCTETMHQFGPPMVDYSHY